MQNVASYRKATGVWVNVPGIDCVWRCGLGWQLVYLVEDHGQELALANVEKLTEFTWRIRQAINEQFPEIDHVELFGPPKDAKANSRNFVLCPGKCTIARRAARARVPSWRASLPTENCAKASRGCRRASSEALHWVIRGVVRR